MIFFSGKVELIPVEGYAVVKEEEKNIKVFLTWKEK